MNVTLGGIYLSEDLTLDIGPAAAAISARRLIGGGMVVQSDAAIGGRTLKLQGENHYTLGQIGQIRDLQALGLPVFLTHHRGNFWVVISDTTELEPTFDHANPPDTDRYIGTITMIEV